jgi:hypothetical protein
MSVDSVALFRPKDPAALRPYLDLDEDSEESNGLYAEALDDGSVLVHTFQSHAAFQASPLEGRAWLTQFGADLPRVHDDPRGLLFFPDVCEPSGRTYDAVVAEVGSAGVWIPAVVLTANEVREREQSLLAESDESDEDDEDEEFPGDDAPLPRDMMQGLPGMAQQLFASMGLGSGDGPVDMGSVIAALQKQLMGALGGQEGAFALAAGGLDPDAFDTVVVLVKRTSPLTLVEEMDHDVNEVTTLADGTAVIHTTSAAMARDRVALGLAEEHAAWVSEHDDARGIPSFGSVHLDAIRGAATYEAAVATLGEAVVFLQPTSIDAIRAEKKASLRKLVE